MKGKPSNSPDSMEETTSYQKKPRRAPISLSTEQETIIKQLYKTHKCVGFNNLKAYADSFGITVLELNNCLNRGPNRVAPQDLTEEKAMDNSESTYTPSDEYEFKGEKRKKNRTKLQRKRAYSTRSRECGKTLTSEADLGELISPSNSPSTSSTTTTDTHQRTAQKPKRRDSIRPLPFQKPNLPNGSHVQNTNCHFVNVHKVPHQVHVDTCRECARGQPEVCLFQNFRVFGKNPNGDLVDGAYFMSDNSNSPAVKYRMFLYFREDFNQDNAFVKSFTAEHLSRMLKSDLDWLKNVDIIIRGLPIVSIGSSPSMMRQLCDNCSTSLFGVYFMCGACGAEICKYCYERLDKIFPSFSGDVNSDENEQSTESSSSEEYNLKFCTFRRLHCTKQFLPVSCVVTYDEALELIHEADIINFVSRPHRVNHEFMDDDIFSSELSSIPPFLSSSSSSDSETKDKVSNWNEEKIEYISGKTSRDPSYSFNKDIEVIPTHSYVPLIGPNADLEVFELEWNMKRVVIVNNLIGKISHVWNPEWICRLHGNQIVTIMDCKTDTILPGEHTVADFFSGFEYLDHREDEGCVWKLKDWPPDQSFEEVFADLYENFEQVLPLKAYTHKYGSLNLASRLPHFHRRLDLGPKMYVAYGTPKNSGPSFESYGTTNFHIDMADAVNIMMYAAEPKAKREAENAVMEAPEWIEWHQRTTVGAVWHIYRIEDVPKIRNFLAEHAKSKELSIVDPIHDQCFYLDKRLRLQLWKKYGVFPYEVIQNPGTAVFIPAGCPHQVYNFASCIKVAMDFVSPQSVSTCQRLTREFSHLGRDHPRQEDLLGLRMLLYYSWKSSLPDAEYIKNEMKKSELFQVPKRKLGSDEDESYDDENLLRKKNRRDYRY